MPYYRDQEWSVHFLNSSSSEKLLSHGCVEITQVEADAILNPPPTNEQIAAQLEAAVDRFVDSTAEARGYGRVGVTPSVACIGYAGYPNQYQTEAITFGDWVSSLWPACYQIQADVLAGLRVAPTETELLAELPQLVWPV